MKENLLFANILGALINPDRAHFESEARLDMLTETPMFHSTPFDLTHSALWPDATDLEYAL